MTVARAQGLPSKSCKAELMFNSSFMQKFAARETEMH
jgi:hypothetical protein